MIPDFHYYRGSLFNTVPTVRAQLCERKAWGVSSENDLFRGSRARRVGGDFPTYDTRYDRALAA